MKAMVSSLALLLLLAVVATGIGTAQTPDPAVQVTSLSVERMPDGVAVRIKTSGPTKYETSFIDSPNRLVIDLPGATYAWKQAIVKSEAEPVRQVRGGQWKGSVARVVVELSRKVGYRIDEDDNGLSIVLEPAGTTQAEKPVAKAREPKSMARSAQGMEARAVDPAKTEAPRDTEAMAAVTPVPPPAVDPKPAPAPARIAQAAPAPAPSPAPPSGPPPMPGGQAPSDTKLISLDFKDADVVNLLRILAAESGRNIVVGEDVKGKVSVSLHNVTWEQALDTIIEARGLQRLDRAGIIRIVSTEQLTKAREAQMREQERQVKDIEIRTKGAEAQLKETEAASKKFQHEVSTADAKARGPLREDIMRLSYADPGEVAHTLQGMFAFAREATEIKPCRSINKTADSTKIELGPGGGVGEGVEQSNKNIRGPIAAPPFSQLFGPPPPPAPAAPPPAPVPEGLAGKGLSIGIHCPTNSLLLRLYAADLERTKKLIQEQLDIPLPQVKIEARMEILDRTAYEGIGVQWGGAGAGNVNNTTTLVGQGFQTSVSKTGAVIPALQGVLLGDGTTVLQDPVAARLVPSNGNASLNALLPVSGSTGLPLGGNVVNLPFGALPGATAAGQPAGGISFGLVSGNYNINLALQALATQGKARTLARPEIVTMENTIGTISLGEEIPYATVSSAGTQVQFKEAVLKLDVFPTVVREQIGAKVINKFKMLVTVENNSRGDTINPAPGVSVPVINKRKAETQVLIKEGDRLVVGGVTQGLSSTSVRKVPLFGDIPILGWLFKQKEINETGRELVIFVTPSLVTGQGGAGIATTPIAPK